MSQPFTRELALKHRSSYYAGRTEPDAGGPALQRLAEAWLEPPYNVDVQVHSDSFGVMLINASNARIGGALISVMPEWGRSEARGLAGFSAAPSFSSVAGTRQNTLVACDFGDDDVADRDMAGYNNVWQLSTGDPAKLPLDYQWSQEGVAGLTTGNEFEVMRMQVRAASFSAKACKAFSAAAGFSGGVAARLFTKNPADPPTDYATQAGRIIDGSLTAKNANVSGGRVVTDYPGFIYNNFRFGTVQGGAWTAARTGSIATASRFQSFLPVAGNNAALRNGLNDTVLTPTDPHWALRLVGTGFAGSNRHIGVAGSLFYAYDLADTDRVLDGPIMRHPLATSSAQYSNVYAGDGTTSDKDYSFDDARDYAWCQSVRQGHTNVHIYHFEVEDKSEGEIVNDFLRFIRGAFYTYYDGTLATPTTPWSGYTAECIPVILIPPLHYIAGNTEEELHAIWDKTVRAARTAVFSAEAIGIPSVWISMYDRSAGIYFTDQEGQSSATNRLEAGRLLSEIGTYRYGDGQSGDMAAYDGRLLDDTSTPLHVAGDNQHAGAFVYRELFVERLVEQLYGPRPTTGRKSLANPGGRRRGPGGSAPRRAG